VTFGDDLGSWIRQWRHSARWTQERLAEALGYDVSYVAKIERGRRPASSQFLSRLAAVTEIDHRELARGARRPTPRLRLPVPSTELVGREDEIKEVARLVGIERCVTLAGAPGIGKTSLALEVAWRLAEGFRHGACFVGLAEVSTPAEVTSSVVHALGLTERGALKLDELLFQSLRDRHILLLLDNFEHVLDARELISGLVAAAPAVHVLLTSREVLGVEGEMPYPVRPLPFPAAGVLPDNLGDYPAVKLFVERSRLVRGDFLLDEANAGSVMEICCRLAGLPLAITLTARASRILSPSDIARNLRGRLELATDGEEEPLAHGRLDTALDWSWARLSAGHRALLAGMSVFIGGCSMPAIEAVCGDGGDDVLPALAALERKSLVEATRCPQGDSRFLCLEPIRRYAQDKLRERGLVGELSARHCRYFVGMAETAAADMTAGDKQPSAWSALEADHANLGAAFEWALEQCPESALRLGAALWRFYSLSRISDGRRWLTRALAGTSVVSVERIRALNGLAILARAQGDLTLARSSLVEACSLAVDAGEWRELALARLTEGIVAEDQGLYDLAEKRFVVATDLYRSIGDERGIGHGLNCLGVVALRRGDGASASDQFHAALARFRMLGDRWSVAVTATNLGWIAEQAGELGEARDWYAESQQIWELAGDEHGRGRSFLSLGRVARRRRAFAEARTLLEQALEILYQVGDRRLFAAGLGELADVAYERGRCDIAARLLGAAAALRSGLGTPAWSEEAALEAHVLEQLQAAIGAAAVERLYTMGRALTVEDVVEMVQADDWPPAGRRQGGTANGRRPR